MQDCRVIVILDEIKRLICQCMMGGEVEIISANDELASEDFEEFKKAVVATADELRIAMEEAERRIICGQFSEIEPKAKLAEYMEPFDWLPTKSPKWTRKWATPENWSSILKGMQLLLQCRRCRWRPRETRRQLDGLSPGIVITEGVSALETEQ